MKSHNQEQLEKLINTLNEIQSIGFESKDGKFDFPLSFIKGETSVISREIDSLLNKANQNLSSLRQAREYGYFLYRHVQKSGANVYCVRGGWTCDPLHKKTIFKSPEEAYQSENW